MVSQPGGQCTGALIWLGDLLKGFFQLENLDCLVNPNRRSKKQEGKGKRETGSSNPAVGVLWKALFAEAHAVPWARDGSRTSGITLEDLSKS